MTGIGDSVFFHQAFCFLLDLDFAFQSVVREETNNYQLPDYANKKMLMLVHDRFFKHIYPNPPLSPICIRLEFVIFHSDVFNANSFCGGVVMCLNWIVMCSFNQEVVHIVIHQV